MQMNCIQQPSTPTTAIHDPFLGIAAVCVGKSGASERTGQVYHLAEDHVVDHNHVMGQLVLAGN
jgi:hypothetical protein